MYFLPYNFNYSTISQILQAAKVHLDAVTQERKLYREVCKTSRETLKTTYSSADGVLHPPPPRCTVPPCSVQMTMHYSFDMAQQVKVNNKVVILTV